MPPLRHLSGFITEIIVKPWERVDISTTLVRIVESVTESVDSAIAYVLIDDVDKLDVGMPVNIKVQGSVDRSSGIIKGTVSKINELPVSSNIYTYFRVSVNLEIENPAEN